MFIGHLLLFALSIGIIWFFGGLLVEAVSRVAKRFNKKGFTVAFFVLGFLTSISEISVMVSSSINNVPQISAGNVAGASLVILLCIIPLLAILGNGIHLRNTLRRKQIALILVAIGSPILFMGDGLVTRNEGLICLLFYCILLYSIQKERSGSASKVLTEVEEELVHRSNATAIDIGKILFAGLIIFVSAYLLVEEVVFFAQFLEIPGSVIGLLILSISTNVPELVIAVRSIGKGRTDIAFGDYLGSATANTLIFSFLPLVNGPFNVAAEEFEAAGILLMIGLVLFYIFSSYKRDLSRKEGIALFALYILFIAYQVSHLIWTAVN
jgi:cation:H+ antiporter